MITGSPIDLATRRQFFGCSALSLAPLALSDLKGILAARVILVFPELPVLPDQPGPLVVPDQLGPPALRVLRGKPQRQVAAC